MNSMVLRNAGDLTFIRHRRQAFDEIMIDARALKQSGLLRHAFKYGLWALRPGGYLRVLDDPSTSQLFTTSRIDFWQVRHEFFKAIGAQVKVERVDDQSGEIIAQKLSECPLPSGVSFCIVFGGGDKDAALLCEGVLSINDSASHHLDQVEVVVCGPVAPDLQAKIACLAPSLSVRYLSYEGNVVAGRIPLSDKKSRVFNAAKFDAVVVSHTRITFAKSVVQTLLTSNFEVLAPRVTVYWKGKNVRFLDYILIGGYQLARRNSAKALGGYSMLDDHLEAMKRRVPYVDGGVMIFNKQAVPLAPFDARLAWGEAEDVDACANLYQNGVLIDFDDRVQCESHVIKFKPLPSYWFRITWPVKKILIRRGWY